MKTLMTALLATCLAFAAAADTEPASDYVQDGLVCHFDGIENVGYGLAHADATNRWVDLTGNGYDWSLDLAKCSWTEKGLYLKGSGKAGWMDSKTGDDFTDNVTTVEFVYADDAPTTATILLTPGYDSSWILYTDTAGHVGFIGSTSTPKSGYAATGYATNTYSVVYNRTGAKPTSVKNFTVGAVTRSDDSMND